MHPSKILSITQKVRATQEYMSLLFHSALLYILAALSYFAHKGTNCTLHSVQHSHFTDRSPSDALLEKILLHHESQESEFSLWVLCFKRCVYGMGPEAAGRGMRGKLMLPIMGYIRQLLKGVGPWKQEQTSVRVAKALSSLILVACSHVLPSSDVGRHQDFPGSLFKTEN